MRSSREEAKERYWSEEEERGENDTELKTIKRKTIRRKGRRYACVLHVIEHKRATGEVRVRSSADEKGEIGAITKPDTLRTIIHTIQ
jgi:hypothetical protein